MLRVIADESWLITLDSEVGVQIVTHDIMIRDINALICQMVNLPPFFAICDS